MEDSDMSNNSSGPMVADDFNPMAAEIADDPFTAFGVAREECPVRHTAQFSPEFYSLTRFSDIFAALNDAEAEQWSARYGSSFGSGPLSIGVSTKGIRRAPESLAWTQ